MRKYIRTDADHPDFCALVRLLDADLAVRDGEEHAFYAQYNHIVDIPNVVLAYDGESVAACGAFKKLDTYTVEIKRMYTLPGYRGKGIAQEVLSRLEFWAKEMGFSRCILETGKKQPEAIRLYGKSGYSVIENYGQYAGVENSVCFEKCV